MARAPSCAYKWNVIGGVISDLSISLSRGWRDRFILPFAEAPRQRTLGFRRVAFRSAPPSQSSDLVAATGACCKITNWFVNPLPQYCTVLQLQLSGARTIRKQSVVPSVANRHRKLFREHSSLGMWVKCWKCYQLAAKNVSPKSFVIMLVLSVKCNSNLHVELC